MFNMLSRLHAERAVRCWSDRPPYRFPLRVDDIFCECRAEFGWVGMVQDSFHCTGTAKHIQCRRYANCPLCSANGVTYFNFRRTGCHVRYVLWISRTVSR